MRLCQLAGSSLLAASLVSAWSIRAQSVDNQHGERAGRAATGYLNSEERPNAPVLLSPPPRPGSTSFLRDEAAARAALVQRGSARWSIATEDAKISLPNLLDRFSCAMGTAVTPETYPKLATLLSRALPDISSLAFSAKVEFPRRRPFAVNGAPICQAGNRNDDSYPSGHSAVGWGLALLLAEIAPDNAKAILARGRAYGESRIICNMHWLSDVEEGRNIASTAVERLHASSQFRADLRAAREEFVGARKTLPPPGRQCVAEARILLAG